MYVDVETMVSKLIAPDYEYVGAEPSDCNRLYFISPEEFSRGHH
jgi:hypothetical protein